MARPRGAGFSSELTLAAPILTSFTTIPGVPASAWLTRRMQEPQCIPSILSAYSANFSPSVVYLMIEAGKRFALPGRPAGRKPSSAVTELACRLKIDTATSMDSIIEREFPSAPHVGVGAVVVQDSRVLLVRRGTEPLKGHWTLPGGLLEVGEALTAGVIREVREETGLDVEPIELIELLDRIYHEGDRVRYHYVIADYLCRVTGGELSAASDADAVRWVERAEWNSHSALVLDPITVRVLEKGWQRAEQLRPKRLKVDEMSNERQPIND
jgi:8-oxo-dGTP diphosphatase